MPYKQGVTGSSPVVSTKTTEGFPSVFCCPQQPSARHNAARLSAEPVTSHCSRSRKPHPPSPRLLFAFTLRRSAPFVCIPLPRAPLLPRFALAVPSLPSLRVQLFPPKLPRGFPSVFCCPQPPSARHNAARLSAEPVTSHCSRSRKPHPPSPRFLFAFTLRRSAPFVCALFHTPHLLPREMPVSGFDRKIRAKWRQSCVGKRCRNSEYPSSKRDFRHGTHLPESQKKVKNNRSEERLFPGDPTETRTRVTAVKGRCLNRLTMGPFLVAAVGFEPTTCRV